MFIETAIKNYTLNTLINIGPVDFEHVFTNLLNDYKSENTGNSKYRDKMKKRLELRNKINEAISYNYSDIKSRLFNISFTRINKCLCGLYLK